MFWISFIREQSQSVKKIQLKEFSSVISNFVLNSNHDLYFCLILIWVLLGFNLLFFTPSFAQHDRERNAFRFLAENKVEKAYFELKNGKKHTDPAEKAFISSLCLLKEAKTREALVMAKKAVALGLPFERLLTEPREWLAPLRRLPAFQIWKNQMQPSIIIHGPMLGQVTDDSVSFWFLNRWSM